MNKAELITSMAEKSQLTKKDAETALAYKNKILTGWKEYNNIKFER